MGRGGPLCPPLGVPSSSILGRWSQAQHPARFLASGGPVTQIIGNANDSFHQLNIAPDRLIALVVKVIFHSRAHVSTQKDGQNIDVDLLQTQGAGLEYAVFGQIPDHEKDTVRAGGDPTLLAENKLHEVGLVERVSRNQVFQQVRWPA